MNEHIYIDREEPVASLVQETLSDGSHVWNIVIRNKVIGCVSKQQGRQAMMLIEEALRKFTMAEVFSFRALK